MVLNSLLGARKPRFGRGLSPDSMLSTTATRCSMIPVVLSQDTIDGCVESPSASSRTRGSLSASDGRGRSGGVSGAVPAGGASAPFPGVAGPAGGVSAAGGTGFSPDGAKAPMGGRSSRYQPTPTASPTSNRPTNQDRIPLP